MIKGLDYWFDAQQRRFLEQIVRALSGFQYQTGGASPQLVMVPCRMATTDKMAAYILKNGSDNTLLTVPMICIYQTGLQGRRADVQALDLVETIRVDERKIDPATGKYTGEIGRRFQVQRLMARPFEMQVNVDIWTSNLDQKHQLSEQILTVLYPDITIQNSENGLDWTAMTTMQVDNINWTSRTIPVGTSDEIDIMTISLRLPMWLSPPAKVQEQKIIQQIVTNVEQGTLDEDGYPIVTNTLTQIITTPGDHSVLVQNNKITLLGAKGGLHAPTGDVYDWAALLQLYGNLNPTVSQLRLKTNPDLDDSSHDLVGTIQLDQNNKNELFWQLDPDTLPANTLSPIRGVIDPRETWPDHGLPTAANGQSYLVIHSLSAPSVAWGTLEALENDIIQYNNGTWTVAYRPTAQAVPQYVLNSASGRQLRWNGEDWVLTIDGEYQAGQWRLRL